MKIIKNHFIGKDTYIVGKYIRNGGRTFTIEELNEICHRFKVPDSIKEEVRLAYYENSISEENWEMLLNSDDLYVKYLVAKNGKYLDTPVKDDSWLVRAWVAEQRYGLDILVKDEDDLVRKTAIDKLKELNKGK